MDKILNIKDKERVLLLGVFETDGAASGAELMFDKSMEELDALVRACEMEPVGRNTQQLPGIQAGYYMGSGKLEEIRERIEELRATLVIANDTLTPTQLRNLQKELSIPVMDRTSLILEIFKKRARSREAKLQVELANLQYIKPRLIGMWETQNRQGGASGAMSSKGEGETQLELDRREIDHRLAELRRELKEVEKERETQRKKRRNSRLPLVSLVGYTNAGKSAIMNAMLRACDSTAGAKNAGCVGVGAGCVGVGAGCVGVGAGCVRVGAGCEKGKSVGCANGSNGCAGSSAGCEKERGVDCVNGSDVYAGSSARYAGGAGDDASFRRSVFEENMLFATLDTSIRKIETGNNQDFMLSDTVGFVNKLPTSLVEAFKSTLEEVREADLLLHVIDYSDPGFKEQIDVTEKMIAELGCGHIPVIRVYNKCDACFPAVAYPRTGPATRDTAGNLESSIYMCAKEDSSIELLTGLITEALFDAYQDAEFLIPYSKGAVASRLQDCAIITSTEYTAEGTLIRCRCHKAEAGKYREFLTPAYAFPEETSEW